MSLNVPLAAFHSNRDDDPLLALLEQQRVQIQQVKDGLNHLRYPSNAPSPSSPRRSPRSPRSPRFVPSDPADTPISRSRRESVTLEGLLKHCIDVAQRQKNFSDTEHDLGLKLVGILTSSDQERTAPDKTRGSIASCGSLADALESFGQSTECAACRTSPAMLSEPSSPVGVNRASSLVALCKKVIFTGNVRSKALHEMMVSLIIEFASIPVNSMEKYHSYICKRTAHVFHAEQADYWIRDEEQDELIRSLRTGEVLSTSNDTRRVPCAVISTGCALSIGDGVRNAPTDETFDEETEKGFSSILAVPLTKEGRVAGSAVLQNKYYLASGEREFDGAVFSEEDGNILEALSLVVALLLHNGKLFATAKKAQSKAEVLLQLAGLISSADLDEKTLIPAIMNTAKQLTNSDRCSVFTIDDSGPEKELVAHLQGQQKIRMPLTTGIAGYVCTTGEPVCVPEAYNHPLFNQEVDRRMGYRTRSMLCFPVRYENSIVAVAQLVNKLNPVSEDIIEYTAEDVELLRSFSVFIGVSLRNCNQQSRLRRALQKNLIMMKAISRLTTVDVRKSDEVIRSVVYGAKEMVCADRCSIFLVDKERNELYSSITDSHDTIRIPIGKGIAGSVCKMGRPENIPNAYDDPRFNPEIDRRDRYKTRSILCFPVKHEKEVVAVIQLINKLDYDTQEAIAFTKSDEECLRDFALFAGMSLYNSKIYEFAVSARDDAMSLLIAQEGTIPKASLKSPICPKTPDFEKFEKVKRTVLPVDVREDVLSSAFDIHVYRLNPSKADELIHVLVEIFSGLGYLESLKVETNVLIRFLIAVREKYRLVPYHNFYHAADVCQTTGSFLHVLRDSGMVDDLDGFALLITSLVHDIDHMGLNNSFHFKAETPMSMLCNTTGSQSVLEVHHCNLAIQVLSDPACDVFARFSPSDVKRCYKVMIDCILATDMARHGAIQTMFQRVSSDGLDPRNSDHRLLLLQMLLKTADISNVAKPFAISRLWAMAVTEEFYQQGDREKEMGGEVDPMYNRSDGDLAKGQVGFIRAVAIPHFTLMASALLPLRPWLERVHENVSIWESRFEEDKGCTAGDAVAVVKRLSEQISKETSIESGGWAMPISPPRVGCPREASDPPSPPACGTGVKGARMITHESAP